MKKLLNIYGSVEEKAFGEFSIFLFLRVGITGEEVRRRHLQHQQILQRARWRLQILQLAHQSRKFSMREVGGEMQPVWNVRHHADGVAVHGQHKEKLPKVIAVVLELATACVTRRVHCMRELLCSFLMIPSGCI